APTREPPAPDFGPQILETLQQLIGVVHERLPPPQVPREEDIQLGDEELIGEDAHPEPPEHDIPRRERSCSPSILGERVASFCHSRSHSFEGPFGDRRPLSPVRPHRQDRDTGSVIRDLLHLQPPTFTGSTDGFGAESWLLSLDSCFGLHSHESNVKARFAIHLLRDAAGIWWRNEERKLHLTRDTVTWELFEERFRAWYMSEHFVQKRIDEFHDLRQGSGSV
ncbi:hypothetical protein KI387_029580, partial [Taxus chinensis]